MKANATSPQMPETIDLTDFLKMSTASRRDRSRFTDISAPRRKRGAKKTKQ